MPTAHQPSSKSNTGEPSSRPPPLLPRPHRNNSNTDSPRAAADEIDYLNTVESALLQEIQFLQSTLEKSRRNAGSSTPGHHDNYLKHALSDRARSTIPSLANNGKKRPRSRVISISLRLPTQADRETVRQQLFDLALPPKAVLSLDTQIDTPFVWVGLANSASNASHLTASHSTHSLHRMGNVKTPYDHDHTDMLFPGEKLSSPNREVPITMDEEHMHSFLSFSEDTLYRVLHYDYGAVVEGTETSNHGHYEMYQIVTQRFAQAVCEIHEEGDLIWVHNHHLMMLPAMIRQRLWKAKIGFFLYISFPSAELFRILPMRTAILNGVLGADLIGFYAYDYAKQFVAACTHLLGLEATPSSIVADPRGGRKCEIRIYPAGIDVKKLKAHVDSEAIKARTLELREQFTGRKIVVGVERLDDCFAGIPLTMLAFEKMLTDDPSLAGKVVLVQVAMLPRESKANNTNRALMTQINEMVGSINAAFGSFTSSPVHYITTELTPDQLHSVMCAGHVCIVNKIRGMGLIPHKWTVCQHGGYKGPIILSEFSGSARNFASAIHVNPWDVEDVAIKLKEALNMDVQARGVQNEVAYRYVSAHTAAMWGMNFLADLEHVEGATHAATHLKTPELDTSALIRAYRDSSCLSAMSSPISSSNTLSALGREESAHSGRTLSFGGANSNSNAQGTSPSGSVGLLRSPEIEIPIPRNNSSNLGSRNTLNNSSTGSLASGSGGGANNSSTMTPSKSQRIGEKKKLFILDYEGTLSQFQPLAEISSPTDRVRAVISAILAASTDNIVLLLSGHRRKNLVKWFGDLDLFLAAEDGCFLRTPGRNEDNNSNTNSNGNSNGTWIPLYAQPSNRKVHLTNTDSLSDMSFFHDSNNPNKSGNLLYPLDNINNNSNTKSTASPDATTRNESNASGGGAMLPSIRKDGSKEKLQHVGNGNKVAALAGDGKCNNESAFVSGLYKGSLSSIGSYDGGSSDSDEMVSKWKGNVKQVMEFFAERTPGALVEEGEASLTWHFVDADREFGLNQSRALQKHLELFLVQNLNMNIVSEEGRNRWLKVLPVGIDKADAVYKTMELIHEGVGRTTSNTTSQLPEDDDVITNNSTSNNSRIDFVFCVGDDRADEGMFSLLRDEKQCVDLGISGISNRMFTTRVGSSATAAMYAIESNYSVIDLLEELIRKAHGIETILEEDTTGSSTGMAKSAPV